MEKVEQNDNVNRDELIMQQQREIEKEISESIPLVSEQLPVTCLNVEYLGDAVFTSKIQDLASKYKFMRRTRPDGNCFFRAFAYAYLEHLISNKEDYEKFRQLAENSKEKLVQLGFPSFTLEDFHETFMEVVKRVDPSGSAAVDINEQLHKVFNDQGYSDYVVVYLRLLTSGKLQEEADFYQNFIEGNFTIEEFRHQEVEPMYKESDHIHIIALCSALGVGVRVEYMDRGEGGTVKAHDFPEGTTPKVFLIYRPGHYDILYPK
ncbi:putative ubiquitin thioesterase otubain [Lucilia cuprina]|uniref:ubiquitinyl hydrolase 1 n=1 Tax=Lucilia cuprina TaxID=7375 RepID=A0A0L0CHQ9_LUCCU|nr:ubiquitin thioesterase otubain-like [Lucilia cuprina]XP_037821778.1 ubiquitin thioesterase otubain-like [Lucilia sericata]KAI8119295.1 Ubiquitin thioesterase otubain-like [Lucilia cuprina]KNC31752.1 putative ubiquitin thioesterase otubain [Lucilia cuprina]